MRSLKSTEIYWENFYTTQEPIDFKETLTYLLFNVPLSLAYSDGTKRSTQKSKLLELTFNNKDNEHTIDVSREVPTLIIDMIAHYRVISTNPPDTFEERIFRFLKTIPNGSTCIDIVADTYREFSFKSSERIKRGSSAKLLIKSVKSKIAREINKNFSNNDNKLRLISMTFSYIKDNPEQCLNLIKCEKVVL